MKKNFQYTAVLAVVMIVQSCGSPDRKDRDDAASTVIDSISDTTARAQAVTADVDLDGDEKTFLIAAATGGLMEVEFANVVVARTKNQSVKTFATMMLKDHGKANNELASIASSVGIELPKMLPDDKMMHLRELKKLNDLKFDEQYMTMMIGDHAKTMKLFTEGSMLSSPQIKSFATKTLPVITSHYQEAVRIGKSMNLSNTGKGDDLQGMSPAAGHSN